MAHTIAIVAGLAAVLAGPSAARAASGTPQGEEGDGAADAVSPEDVPLSERETRAPAHPDCTNHVPLWEHQVAPGEHLGVIAGRYGVRVRDLIELNPDLSDPDLIVPGQKLRVCPEIAPRLRKQVVHVVQAGQTLSGIAAAHELSAAELVELLEEPLTDPNRLQAGATLRFSVDGGMVEDFLPPPPRAKRRAGGRRKFRHGPVDVQLSAHDGVHIKRPHLAFGTKKTISLLEQVIERYRRRHAKGPKVLIGDLSRRGGGKIPPHASHRRGVDVDVGYVLKGADGRRTRFSGVNRDNLDLTRTWALVKAFLDTHEVKYIFMDYSLQELLYEHAKAQGASEGELDELFQYPRGRGRSHGIIRHWPSHKHHFHVRFRG